MTLVLLMGSVFSLHWSPIKLVRQVQDPGLVVLVVLVRVLVLVLVRVQALLARALELAAQAQVVLEPVRVLGPVPLLQVVWAPVRSWRVVWLLPLRPRVAGVRMRQWQRRR